MNGDQIFYTHLGNLMIWKINTPKRLSTGLGRTLVHNFYQTTKRSFYAIQHLGDENVFLGSPQSKNWRQICRPIYDSLWYSTADLDGKYLKSSWLCSTNAGLWEILVSPKGDSSIVLHFFRRTGDLELYTMNIDGTDVKQITYRSRIWRRSFLFPGWIKANLESIPDQQVNEEGRSTKISGWWIGDATPAWKYTSPMLLGSEFKKLKTDLRKSKLGFRSFIHQVEKIIFASNHPNGKGYPFNLFISIWIGNSSNHNWRPSQIY